MSISQILEGWKNKVIPPSELKDVIEQASKERMDICKDCPLITDSSIGKVCNSKLYVNPITDETSKFPKEGYYRGCGCVLTAKTSCLSCSCPANKWESINVKEE